MANPNWPPGYYPRRGHLDYQTPYFTPYGHGRSRGVRGRGTSIPHASAHHNRVLVNNNPPPPSSEPANRPKGLENVAPTPSLVTDSAATKSQHDLRRIRLSDIDFRLSSDGRTLRRLTSSDTPPETPSELYLAGKVKFTRSKNGNNMYRSDKLEELRVKR